MLKEYESICTTCGKKINDNVQTEWNKEAEPFCKKCFKTRENEKVK